MLREGRKLLPSIQRLERLLGHNLNITEDIIQQRVQEAIDRQIHEIDLRLLPLDPTKVDWRTMMLNAAHRRPPFDPSEKEKGFRDALLVEGFLQLASLSPKTPAVCRIALLTGDALVMVAVKARTSDATNLQIFHGLEELKGFINILISKISEEFAVKIQEKASQYFFEVDKKDTLYYKENVYRQIFGKFDNILDEKPENTDTRENERWLIHKPQFVKKLKQRMFWITRIVVEAKAYKHAVVNLPREGLTTSPYRFSASIPRQIAHVTPSGAIILSNTSTPGESVHVTPSGAVIVSNNLSPNFGLNASETMSGFLKPWPTSFGVSDVIREKVLMMNGTSTFEIIWSVIITAKEKFSAPKIESIEHKETVWEGI